MGNDFVEHNERIFPLQFDPEARQVEVFAPLTPSPQRLPALVILPCRSPEEAKAAATAWLRDHWQGGWIRPGEREAGPA